METVTLNDPKIRIPVRRNARARRISLRISRTDGGIRITMPPKVPLAEAAAFAQFRAGWIARQLDQVTPRMALAVGETVLFRGEPHVIVESDHKAVAAQDKQLLVPSSGKSAGAMIRAFFKTEARSAFAHASDRYAAELGQRYNRLSLRDTRSRWGSCTSEGNLMYSWRLIMAPPSVLHYVAAHEVVHLRHMDHSPAFWRVVAQICPGWERERLWLRQNGTQLHAVDFGD